MTEQAFDWCCHRPLSPPPVTATCQTVTHWLLPKPLKRKRKSLLLHFKEKVFLECSKLPMCNQNCLQVSSRCLMILAMATPPPSPWALIVLQHRVQRKRFAQSLSNMQELRPEKSAIGAAKQAYCSLSLLSGENKWSRGTSKKRKQFSISFLGLCKLLYPACSIDGKSPNSLQQAGSAALSGSRLLFLEPVCLSSLDGRAVGISSPVIWTFPISFRSGFLCMAPWIIIKLCVLVVWHLRLLHMRFSNCKLYSQSVTTPLQKTANWWDFYSQLARGQDVGRGWWESERKKKKKVRDFNVPGSAGVARRSCSSEICLCEQHIQRLLGWVLSEVRQKRELSRPSKTQVQINPCEKSYCDVNRGAIYGCVSVRREGDDTNTLFNCVTSSASPPRYFVVGD